MKPVKVKSFQLFEWSCPLCLSDTQQFYPAGLRITRLSCSFCCFELRKVKGTWKPLKILSRGEISKLRAERKAKIQADKKALKTNQKPFTIPKLGSRHRKLIEKSK